MLKINTLINFVFFVRKIDIFAEIICVKLKVALL